MSYVNKGSSYAIGIVFPILCTAAVILRFEARRRVMLPYGADDWAALVALILTITCGFFIIVGSAIFENLEALAVGTLLDPMKLLKIQFMFAMMPISVIAIGAIRLTFALLFLRLFRPSAISLAIRTVIVLTVLWTVGFFIATFFLCGANFGTRHFTPILYTDSGVTQRVLQCSSTSTWHSTANVLLPLYLTVTDTILDIAVFLLPIFPVCQLKMNSQAKIGVLLTFCLGLLSIVGSIMRTVMAFRFEPEVEASAGLVVSTNATHVMSVMFFVIWWTYIEIGVGCLVSNLPPIVGLLRGADPFRPVIRMFSSRFSRLRRLSVMEMVGNDSMQQVLIAGKSTPGPVHEDPGDNIV